ncbi:GNAT family N-acetyltransferase [Listeria ilorinensis]|uniref:GNAT family N-acetyltransferase n=1 Tax=Listeria ilorinensis TaxID=2867439 RepID=UPI001EF57782|nr:GNAT family N-acetyltransferase [Listeria ilorinensis]
MIRQLQQGDQEEARRLLFEVKAGLKDHQWSERYPNEQHLLLDLGRQELFGLFLDGRLSALMTLTQDSAGTASCFEWAEDQLFLKRMMTSPLKRNHGAAQHLLQFAIEFAGMSGRSGVAVVTEQKNGIMQHLLSKAGFELLAERDIEMSERNGHFLAFQRIIGVPTPFLLE